jgi:uncharacterized protein (DUF1697 family)
VRSGTDYVAFFRNVNLGQRGGPTKAQLERAFRQAGAATAASFLSNGTLIFSVWDESRHQALVQRARRILQEWCGLQEPAFCRSLQHLGDLIRGDPFAEHDAPAIAGRFVSFFDPSIANAIALPLESKTGDCTVFQIVAGDAFSVTQRVAGRTGYPTPVLERALKTPVTTRGWETIRRLVSRCA